MTIDQFTNILVTIMLIEMMVSVGLGVSFVELFSVLRNGRLVAQAALANFILVPVATVVLLLLFQTADPTVQAGFLILAVCPGAPFGPACTQLAKGNVAVAVGLMAILAGVSALAAPILLRFLLPFLSGDGSLQVDAGKIVVTLLATQLVPLCLGLWLRHWKPNLAKRLLKPANLISMLLSLAAIGLILFTQWPMLAAIRPRGFLGMLCLLAVSLGIGWWLGGPGVGNRKAMSLTTSLRNVGVGLVIATGNFANTAAVTAVLAYGLIEIFGSLAMAMFWGRNAAIAERSSAAKD